MLVSGTPNLNFDKGSLEGIYLAIQEVTEEQFKFSIKKILQTVKDFYPTTNFIGLILQNAGVVSDEKSESNSIKDDAIDANARIFAAVSKFGYMNAEQAKKYIGELGWECVERNGGWQLLCETLTLDNMGILKAQYRETCKAIMGRRKRGVDDMPPALPDNQKLLLPENVKRLTEKIGSKL